MYQKKIAIVGGGSSALFAAEQLSKDFEVHLYEKGKVIGRKFLVAGNGGFNLTNAAVGQELYEKYSASPILKKALENFDSQATRTWLEDLGIPTFVGSSGRVFPEKGIKPIEVLQKIKDRLLERGVQIHCLHEFVGFDENNQVLIKHQDKNFILNADYYIFALGGASWSVTGANSMWKDYFEKIGVKVVDFEASNCGVNMAWTADFASQFAGVPLKNIQISIGEQSIKGEALITENGLEGNAIYPLIPTIRKSLKNQATTAIFIDFKPQNSLEDLLKKVKNKTIATKNYGHEFHLSKAQLAIIKAFTTKEIYTNSEKFVHALKKLALPVQSLRPIEEAISTVGGIDLEELTENFSLKKFPTIFVVGEMLDWDAPTGGFLLQGCFSTAAATVRAIINIK